MEKNDNILTPLTVDQIIEGLARDKSLWFLILKMSDDDEEKAQDVFQEMLLKVKLAYSVSSPNKLRPWAIQIVKNILIHQWKRKKTQLLSEEQESVIPTKDYSTNPLEQAIANELKQFLQDTLEIHKFYTEQEKRIAELIIEMLCKGYEYQDILDSLEKETGIKRNSLFVWVSRIRLKLAVHLKEKGYIIP